MMSYDSMIYIYKLSLLIITHTLMFIELALPHWFTVFTHWPGQTAGCHSADCVHLFPEGLGRLSPVWGRSGEFSRTR